jgi:hypothetical protein
MKKPPLLGGGRDSADNENNQNAPVVCTNPTRRARGGRSSRQKGDRRERELVALHKQLGVHAERVPHSGAMRYRGHGADIDIYLFGRDEAPFVTEAKGRKGGAGFAVIERWLGENDALFCRRDHSDALVVLPWRSWVALLAKIRR